MITKIKENLYTLGEKIIIGRGVGRLIILAIYAITTLISNYSIRITFLIALGIALLFFDAIKSVSELPKKLAMRCKLRYLLLNSGYLLTDVIILLWFSFINIRPEILDTSHIIEKSCIMALVLVIIASIISFWTEYKIDKERTVLFEESLKIIN